MDRYDVAVIGAGPAGSMAAKYAAKAGASTVILEEHAAVGWPVECAGLLGWRALEESELAPGSHLLQGFKGATIYSPGGQRADFKASSFKAWAVDRRLFDRALALEALQEGAELKLRASVRSIRRDKERCLLALAHGRELEARVVISAEGVRARLARQAGIPPPKKTLSGAQVEAPFDVEDPEKVEVHLGIPGLFAWVVPEGEEAARIGLCAREKGCDYLRAFLQKDLIKDRLLGSPGALMVGGLPLGPPDWTVGDGFLAVGDCAGQVKPTSGGGVYPSLVCAKIAGGVAAAAALEGDSTAKRLGEYDKSWRALLGRELGIGMRANRLLCEMNKAEMDEVVAYLNKRSQLLRVIEKYGDIDRPSVLIARMIPHMGTGGIRLVASMRRIL